MHRHDHPPGRGHRPHGGRVFRFRTYAETGHADPRSARPLARSIDPHGRLFGVPAASFLIEVSRSDIAFERDFGPEPLMGTFDSRLMAQAFGNVVKNAAEAIEAAEREDRRPGAVRIQAVRQGDTIRVDVVDNGKGLPRDNRQRLLEPYMTTREKGTGLGLAIVQKIVEDHGGTLELHDAPSDFHEGRGAMITIILPAATAPARAGTQPTSEQETEKVSNGL